MEVLSRVNSLECPSGGAGGHLTWLEGNADGVANAFCNDQILIEGWFYEGLD